jgi:hypothetical protein
MGKLTISMPMPSIAMLIYQRVTSFSKNSMASSPSMSIPPRCVALDLRPRYFESGKYDVEMKDTATGLPFSKVPGRSRAELTDVPWLPWSSYMRYDIHPSQTGNHQNHHIMGVYIYIMLYHHIHHGYVYIYMYDDIYIYVCMYVYVYIYTL